MCTRKQDRFAREYVKDLNATKAAIRAGYSKKTARKQASRLLTKEDIQDRVKKYGKRAEDKCDITTEFILNGLKKNAIQCQQGEPVLDRTGEPTGIWKMDSAGSNKAYELLGKHRRLFTERVEMTDMTRTREIFDIMLAIVYSHIEDDGLRETIASEFAEAFENATAD